MDNFGLSRSKWDLPDCFRKAEISYHGNDSWKEGYFQSAAIGQEFVVKNNDGIEEWAKSIIKGAQIDYQTKHIRKHLGTAWRKYSSCGFKIKSLHI